MRYAVHEMPSSSDAGTAETSAGLYPGECYEIVVRTDDWPQSGRGMDCWPTRWPYVKAKVYSMETYWLRFH